MTATWPPSRRIAWLVRVAGAPDISRAALRISSALADRVNSKTGQTGDGVSEATLGEAVGFAIQKEPTIDPQTREVTGVRKRCATARDALKELAEARLIHRTRTAVNDPYVYSLRDDVPPVRGRPVRGKGRGVPPVGRDGGSHGQRRPWEGFAGSRGKGRGVPEPGPGTTSTEEGEVTTTTTERAREGGAGACCEDHALRFGPAGSPMCRRCWAGSVARRALLAADEVAQ